MKDKNKSLEEYGNWTGSSKHASDFEITTKFMINYVQETFDSVKDVAEALRMMNDPSTA